jgi:hypothetical protein
VTSASQTVGTDMSWRFAALAQYGGMVLVVTTAVFHIVLRRKARALQVRGAAAPWLRSGFPEAVRPRLNLPPARLSPIRETLPRASDLHAMTRRVSQVRAAA